MTNRENTELNKENCSLELECANNRQLPDQYNLAMHYVILRKMKKEKIRSRIEVLLLCVILISGCKNFIGKAGQTVGTWEGNVYTNNWLGFTFEMPDGYYPSDLNSYAQEPGHLDDFAIINGDHVTLIYLTYTDVSFGIYRTHTAEYYISYVMDGMLDSENRNYEILSFSQKATIAETEYQVLSTAFTAKDDPEHRYYQDLYVRRYQNSMITLYITYSEETQPDISRFLASIRKP